jgi:glutathione synthase/RimK-type ligase-like ATP-grasp enzyme
MKLFGWGKKAASPAGFESKKSIGIFCNSLELGGDPFSSDYYWQAYQDLMLALKERAVDVYLLTDNNSYLGDGKFSVAYTIDNKRELSNLIKVENISVNLVFNRGNFTGQDVFMINDPVVYKIGMNKIEMHKYFSKFQPLSFPCNNREELEAAFQKIEGDKVVVKEPEGYGGKDVYIGTKAEVLNKLPDRYPLLVQEFLDTSAGIPGLVNGVHDIRLSICGGELIGCYIREAKEGELHSNVSLGGTMKFLDVSNVPAEVWQAAKEIDGFFKQYPRYYSIDFMFTAKGWKMLELNPLLALLPVTDGEEAVKTLTRLADYLANQVKSSR